MVRGITMDKLQLLYDFYNASSSEELYKIVCKNNLDGSDNWRPYGGNVNNAGTFENQQSSPENSLVEKLTNSMDAILMRECVKRGIDPKDKSNSELPRDMADAIERFYSVKDGRWENKLPTERNTMAQNVQIILTGDRKTPNVAIYDNGEGQNPERFPDTFLSVAHGNKNDIPFVQGKYNMGATGAVVFCGEEYRYQMIISRRSTDMGDSNGRIGFTLVRRHILTAKEENEVKLSWYEYLVIDNEIPYVDTAELDLGLNKDAKFISGSVVKMYSYQLTHPSDATLDLWRELNPLLFVPAIPILICENRFTAGHSSTKAMLGNRTRLALDDNKRLVFTKAFQITLFGSNIPITVYIFNRETKNPEFIGGKSLIYTLNGQTQGSETKSFISQDLGYRNLREYMLIAVDCSQIGTTARQELFMASRDRLKQGKYYTELRNDIISLLRSDSDINNMDQEYKGKSFKEKADDKDLVESMFSHLKSNKDIKNMFSGTDGAFSFFKKHTTKPNDDSEKKKPEKEPKKVALQRHPSIFRVKGFDKDDTEYVKAIKKGGKGSITLETDAENEFLTRSYDNGKMEITTLDYGDRPGGGERRILPNTESTKLKVQASGPYDGEIKVYIEPKEDVEVGERIPLSIKMISSAGEHEVIVFIKIEEERQQPTEKKKPVEEPELNLPQLVRVVKESDNPEEATWASCGMTADDPVKLIIGKNGAIDEVRINMDSNIVKKIMNTKNVNIERTRDKYIRNVYAHSLMVYTTMFGYYSSHPEVFDDEETIKEIQDNLNKAVEYSFKYYTNFLMVIDDIDD